jgi:hypothetical protein
MAPVLRIPAPMKVLAFRPRSSPSTSRERLNFPLLAPGAYAGRARFRPKHADRLPEALRAAVGRVVEVAFAGMESTAGPFAGQALFLEWRSDDVFAGFFIPEQDLEFLKDVSEPHA